MTTACPKDLGFSSLEGVRIGDVMEQAIREACDAAAELLNEYAPVDILCERYAEKRPHPRGQEAFTIRARLPWQRQPQTRVLIEITVDEKILKPTPTRKIIHEYGEPLEAGVRVYALEDRRRRCRTRPGSTPFEEPPDFAFTGVRAPRHGAALEFLRDVVGQLGRTEHDVPVRFTPFDGVAEGQRAATPDSFRVDNNGAPIVQLQNDAVIANPDDRRGIPIPFRRGDLLQWRREGEAFPELPADPARACST